jgi:ribonuclease-3
LVKSLFSFFRRTNKSKISSEFDEQKKKNIFSKIESLVGIKPTDDKYFLKAFTHRSYLEKSSNPIKSNERLEFLGDSILGKIVSEYLFENYSKEDEGFLTKARSHLVNKHSLEKIALNLNLQDLIFTNDDYLIKDKKKISNIVADCLEALIAAIYLDMGEETATNFVKKYVIFPQADNGNIESDKNYKGQLLELSHSRKLNQPVYKIVDQVGPQHDKIYTVQVILNNEVFGIGKGPNKKNAEQKAAKNALKVLTELEKGKEFV